MNTDKLIDKIYAKYHSIRLVQEDKKIKYKENLFADLFRPEAPFSFNEFAEKIESLGVKASDNILFRPSAQLMPYLEGGIVNFYKNLFNYVDSGHGNVLSFSFSFDRSPMMYLAMGHTFSADDTPTSVGLCNEIFRRMEGTARSIHPTHSVSVYGRDKEEIVKGHHLDPYTYSDASPFAHLFKYGAGKEIIIGLNHSTVGQHFIERVSKVTGCIDKPILARLKINGETQKLPFFADNPFVKFVPYFHNPEFVFLLKKMGVLQQTFLNGISIYVYDSKAFLECMSVIYNSYMKPIRSLKGRTFILDKMVRPLVLKKFFRETSDIYIPKSID